MTEKEGIWTSVSSHSPGVQELELRKCTLPYMFDADAFISRSSGKYKSDPLTRLVFDSVTMYQTTFSKFMEVTSLKDVTLSRVTIKKECDHEQVLSVPSEITQLGQLEVLTITNFVRTIPTVLTTLTALRRVSFDRHAAHEFHGKTDVEGDLTGLASLPRLESLEFCGPESGGFWADDISRDHMRELCKAVKGLKRKV